MQTTIEAAEMTAQNETENLACLCALCMNEGEEEVAERDLDPRSVKAHAVLVGGCYTVCGRCFCLEVLGMPEGEYVRVSHAMGGAW